MSIALPSKGTAAGTHPHGINAGRRKLIPARSLKSESDVRKCLYATLALQYFKLRQRPRGLCGT
jgi:hypothetical protein